MNLVNSGLIIKNLRKAREMTQNELADEICTVKEIQRIEKGLVLPNLYIFEKLLSRLGVDIYASMHAYVNAEYQIIYDKISKINRLIIKREYSNANDEYNHLETHPLFDMSDFYIKQFSLYVKSVFMVQIHENYDEALKTSEAAIKITIPKFKPECIDNYILSKHEYLIINTMSIVYNRLGNADKAIYIYKKLYDNLSKKNDHDTIKLTLLTTICYNLSSTLGQKKLYNEAIVICNEGIEACKQAHTFTNYGELLYNKACCLYGCAT